VATPKMDCRGNDPFQPGRQAMNTAMKARQARSSLVNGFARQGG
jgi:hypothetical protein